jgi:hypothetical protein
MTMTLATATPPIAPAATPFALAFVRHGLPLRDRGQRRIRMPLLLRLPLLVRRLLLLPLLARLPLALTFARRVPTIALAA